MKLFAIPLVSACAVAAAWQKPADDGLARVDEIVREQMASAKIPGVAVAIVRKGEVVKAEAYGEANVEHHVPVTPDTIFQSGSLGKMFTAVAAMLLVEDGKLALSDSVTKFFPKAPPAWTSITVEHLLTHTSGLPDYTAGTIDYRRDYTEDELVSFAHGLTLEFPPGSRWNYSNTGYVLLGAAIRKASGSFYGDILRARVFEPLGMKTARVISEEDIVPNRAAGYRLVDGVLKNQEWVSPSLNTTADGALYLSLRDMIAWDRGVREKRLLKPESWARIFSPVTLKSGRPYPYGFGWRVDRVGGGRLHDHGGAWQGFTTFMARFVDEDLSIVVLTNLAGAEPATIAERIAASFDPRIGRPKPSPLTDVPEAQARARKVLADTVAGRLAPSEFAYLRAGFFPDVPKRYAELLRKAGAVQSLTLYGNTELGDDRIYTYEIRCEKAVLRMRLGIAPDGKISVYGLGRAQ